MVVMPNVTRKKADVFVKALCASIAEHGHFDPVSKTSPLSMLSDPSWGGHWQPAFAN